MNAMMARHVMARLALGLILHKEMLDSEVKNLFTNVEDLKKMLSYGQTSDFVSEATKTFIFLAHRLYRARTEKKLKQINKACHLILPVLKKDLSNNRILYNAISIISMACSERLNKDVINYANLIATYGGLLYPRFSSQIFFETASSTTLIEQQITLAIKYANKQATFEDLFVFDGQKDFFDQHRSEILPNGEVEYVFVAPDMKLMKMLIPVNDNDSHVMKPLFKSKIRKW